MLSRVAATRYSELLQPVTTALNEAGHRTSRWMGAIATATLVLSFALVSLPASADEPMNTSKNKSASIVFVPDFVPCGGTCIGGDVEGTPCSSDEDCVVGGFCRDRYDALVSPRPLNISTPEEGLAACGPSQTFNEQAGSPANGWHFGPKSKAQLKLKRKKGDLTVQLKLGDIQDSVGRVEGAGGGLLLVFRMRRLDPVLGDMSVVDLPLTFAIPALSKGKGGVKGSLNEAFNALFATTTLPSAELAILQAKIIDPNGNSFATRGIGDEDAGDVRISLEGGGPAPKTCPAGRTLCASHCANLQTSFFDCGACGNDCYLNWLAGGEVGAFPKCVGGICS